LGVVIFATAYKKERKREREREKEIRAARATRKTRAVYHGNEIARREIAHHCVVSFVLLFFYYFISFFCVTFTYL
jgi:hypothetical protein